MIKAIFYSQFLPEGGPKVLHQVPDGSVVATPTTPTPTLFNFESISKFVIPQHEFCNRLMTVTKDGYRILGHPIRIYDESKYKRNDFIFNFAIVLEEDADMSSYKAVVTKLARLFRALEEQSQFLSSQTAVNGAPGRGGKVFAMIEQILEDLNNYCECMIPIDESNTINIKLFPKYPPPPPVKAYHVPISTVNLKKLMDVNWDLTMQKIVPNINGLSSVRQIAQLSECSYRLTKNAVSHLLYYGCLILLDTFSFSAIYAPTAEFSTLVSDKAMQEECAAYITIPGTTEPLQTTMIVSLYASLRQGLHVKGWCIEHARFLGGVDVRRFITFGVIKGFLYRVHKYAIKSTDGASPPVVDVGGGATTVVGKGIAATVTATATAATVVGLSEEEKRKIGELPLLAKYLDGTHCLDEICTDLGWSERDILRKLGAYGDVQIIHK